MRIEVVPTAIPDVVVVTPGRFDDERGFFAEVFRADVWAEAGLPTTWAQVNQSRSRRGVLRGLHFQWEPPQAKLMRVVRGEAFVVAVDVRPGSPTLGRWVGETLRGDDPPRLVFAPAGFARGFCALSDVVDVEYHVTGIYNGAAESGIRWDDPDVGIEWPVREPLLSAKDAAAPTLREWLARPEAERFRFGG